MGFFASTVPVITLGSISKKWMVPGWRIGWLATCDPDGIVRKYQITEGIIATYLIGQAPDRFVTAAVRSPMCNLSLMVGTTDIPDWCYVEAYGKNGKNVYTEAPSIEDTVLDCILPCVDVATAEQSLNQSKTITKW